MAGRKMHQTTVRFGPDLWEEVTIEAARAGVSVAQFVRDAALMRVSYTRGREGDPHYRAALEIATSGNPARLAQDEQDLQAAKDARTLRGAARSRQRRQPDDVSAEQALASEPHDDD